MSTFRSHTRTWLAALALLGLCSTGCQVKQFLVRLPGFESSKVLGLWVWRAAPGSAEFERYALIEFGKLVEADGFEFLSYTVTIAGRPFTLASEVERSPTPDDVEVSLSLGTVDGVFKLTSYNAAGESPLSEGTLVY